MNCKNCNFSLRTDYSFCPDCGAKVIHERITFKGLIHDFIERYFNVDNTFIRTVTHLFRRPEMVIMGYLDGIRRKYLNPASLLAIALSLSGITLFLMKNFAWDSIDFEAVSSNVSAEVNRKLVSANMEYSSFIFLGYIPVLALTGLITMNPKQLSFAENMITAIYILANYSITLFPITTVALFLVPEYYMTISLFSLLFMLTYSIYVYWRMNSENNFSSKFARSIGFVMIYFMGFMGISMMTLIINLLRGVIKLKDFLPPGALD